MEREGEFLKTETIEDILGLSSNERVAYRRIESECDVCSERTKLMKADVLCSKHAELYNLVKEHDHEI